MSAAPIFSSELSAAPASRPAAARRWPKILLREPVVHFVLLGLLLFAVSEYLEQRSKFTRIEITQAQIAAMRDTYRLQYGMNPTPQQLDALVDSLIKEEVFYHQALRLNLDQDDEIVRRRLVQKYEFLLQDLTLAQPPSEPQLQGFYAAHVRNYEHPAKVSFSHVFFSADQGEQVAYQRAVAALAELRDGRTGERGDVFPGLSDYAAQSPVQVARIFGVNDLADAIFKVQGDAWQGPYRSGYGWHLVRVTAREAAEVAPYASVRDAVKRDYLEADRARRNDETLQKLLKNFTIVRGER